MRITCPKCGFTFDITYSRAVSCTSCPYATFGDCGYIKCPNCGHEFPYSQKKFF